MSSERAAGINQRLTRTAGDILLKVLEQPKASVSVAVLAEWDGRAGLELQRAGALSQLTTKRTVVVRDDAGSRHVDLHWDVDRQAYGYFDAADGFVTPAASSLATYAASLPWWLAWLADTLDLANAGKPHELVPDHAWDLGDLWVNRRSKVPVIFARRLTVAVRARLAAALQARASRQGGVILTSTRRLSTDASWPLRFRALRIPDILNTDGQRFSIDLNLLRSPYGGESPATVSTSPLSLSPDNRQLTINGRIFPISGAAQQAILRQLVDAAATGVRSRTRDVLAEAKSGSGSLKRAFRGSKVADALFSMLRQERGYCWLELQ